MSETPEPMPVEFFKWTRTEKLCWLRRRWRNYWLDREPSLADDLGTLDVLVERAALGNLVVAEAASLGQPVNVKDWTR